MRTLRLRACAPFVAALVLVLPVCSVAQMQQSRADGPRGGPLGAIPTIQLPAPDVGYLEYEDATSEVIGPLRFGVMIPAELEIGDEAAWSVTPDGTTLVARLRLVAPDAFSLGVEFAEYDLPPGGALWVYDDAMTTVLGPFTQEDRIPTGEFVVEPFPGDTVVLEYDQPSSLPPASTLLLRGLIYDYRNLFELETTLEQGFGDGGCEQVNVNCPEGDPYPDQKRATVRTVYQGGLCSAMLINNTANDAEQLLYTANHCGQGSTTVVRFNYQTANCAGGTAPTNQQVSGATLLANDVDTDGRLMRITGSIPDAYEPFYAGWSRASLDSSFSFALAMHHPGGNPKKIAIDSNGAFKTSANFIGIGLVKVWSVSFDFGSTEGGSSGSPIFDQDNRIRGTLTGGPDNPCNNALYGRFHSFWDETNISTWLDPLGTGPTSIDGFDPFEDVSPANLVSILPGSGPAGGFQDVTLSGTGFEGVTSVTFGGVAALDFDVVGGTQIDATTPPGTQGQTVNVAVTDTFGTDTLVSAYTYTANPAPSVDTITPDSGLVAGGTVVTISGTTVLGVTEVQFGGVPGTGLVLDGATSLDVTTPSAPPGPVDVTVIGNGQDVLVDGFTYTDPGAFVNVGVGLAGQFGLVPNLTGTGDLSPGGAGFTLQTLLAKASAPGAMFIGLVVGAAPFKGGTLYAFPYVLQFPITNGPIGVLNLPGQIPVGIPPGTEIIVQQAFSDTAAVQDVSLTQGLKLIVGA